MRQSSAPIYKLVEIEDSATCRYTAKYSPDKNTMPGRQADLPFPRRDVIGLTTECHGCGGEDPAEALLRPVIIGGELVVRLPSIRNARAYRERSVRALPTRLLSRSRWRTPGASSTAANCWRSPGRFAENCANENCLLRHRHPE